MAVDLRTDLMNTILKWLDENIERVVILFAYSSMAAIIVYAVFERFMLQTQIPWSTSIPIYLFLWVTWFGCSYNVKQRTHLVFNDLRKRMPYRLQYACLWFDAFLWILFSVIVIWFSIEQVSIVRQNLALVQGTNNLLQWYFYLATPLGFLLVIIRVIQNLREDMGRFRREEEFLVDIQAVDKVA